MKNMLCKLHLLLIILVSLICINVSTTYAKDSYDYLINNYVVDIKVNENNTFDISEVLTVQYNIPKHGILRILPIQNNVIRQDGISSSNNARITKVSVNAPYKTSKQDGNFYIKIGSKNETLTGTKTYK